MKINIKTLMDNLKSISNVVSDFIYLDISNSDDCGFYISTDVQAIKVPLEVTEVMDEEKKIYVINKIEFCHLIPYVTEFLTLNSDYSYSANNGSIKGKFESNDDYSNELESRKTLFDHEDEYEEFAEVTPSILNGINCGNVFVKPDSVKNAERYLDIKDKKVFSYSDMRIYINDIEIDHEGLFSNDVIKAIQSMGAGTIIKNNNDSYLLINAQKTLFEYFSTPNNADFHPVLEDKFKAKLDKVKTFNKITMNIDELRDKLDYISFYSSKNPNNLTYLTIENEKVLFSSDENTKVEIPIVNIDKTEEFETMSVPFNCNTMQLVCSKVGKECENLTWYVSSSQENKLMIVGFGDTEETVVIAKLNL